MPWDPCKGKKKFIALANSQTFWGIYSRVKMHVLFCVPYDTSLFLQCQGIMVLDLLMAYGLSLPG